MKPWKLKISGDGPVNTYSVETDGRTLHIGSATCDAYDTRTEMEDIGRRVVALSELPDLLQDIVHHFDLDDLSAFSGDQRAVIRMARIALKKLEPVRIEYGIGGPDYD